MEYFRVKKECEKGRKNVPRWNSSRTFISYFIVREMIIFRVVETHKGNRKLTSRRDATIEIRHTLRQVDGAHSIPYGRIAQEWDVVTVEASTKLIYICRERSQRVLSQPVFFAPSLTLWSGLCVDERLAICHSCECAIGFPARKAERVIFQRRIIIVYHLMISSSSYTQAQRFVCRSFERTARVSIFPSICSPSILNDLCRFN